MRDFPCDLTLLPGHVDQRPELSLHGRTCPRARSRHPAATYGRQATTSSADAGAKGEHAAEEG
jgi:hypothetical protein